MQPSSTFRSFAAAAALFIAGGAAYAQPYSTLGNPGPIPPLPWLPWTPSLHIYENFPTGAPTAPGPSMMAQLRDNGNWLYGFAQVGVSGAPGMYSAIATSYVGPPVAPAGRRSDVVYAASDGEDLIIANLSNAIPNEPPGRYYAIRFTTTPPTATNWPADVERMTILNSGNVGINQPIPVNQFDVGGNAVIGSAYAGSAIAPLDGLLVQGDVGIGYTTNPGPYKLYVNGGTWSLGGFFSSDARWKEHVEPVADALSKVMQLRAVNYDYIKNDKLNFPSGRQLGFIAQEVEKVVPEVVATNKDGYKGLAYQNLTALLAEAIKEQQGTITGVKAENAKLASDNQSLRAQLDEQSARIARLELALQKLNDNAQAKQSSGTASSTAKQAQLFQNDPNPFTESTSIGYYLPPTVSHAELIVYSAASGKEMTRQAIIGTGEGKVIVNGRDLGSGTYYYTMVADGQTVHGKSMIVVK